MDNAPSKGREGAQIGIIEYADFECPACAAFVRKTYPRLVATFVDTGEVRLFFRHFPLPNHPFARPAAIAAQCAAEQGKFWSLYDYIFRLQPRLDEGGRRAAARRVGLDLETWSRCVAEERHEDLVDADFSEARGLELRGTPTFLIGRIRPDGRLQVRSQLYGAQPIEAFEKAIAEARDSSAPNGQTSAITR